jgi:proteasome accessory factor A
VTDFERVPKILGSDVELGNFIDGIDTPSGSGAAAARLLLRAIQGIPTRAGSDGGVTHASRYSSSDQDWGRRFLPGNAGCVYIDLNHLELAAPETLSAYDHVAYTQAMLRVARSAVHRVNAQMPEGYRVHAIANCSDGHGHSYGAHVNVLLTRAAWETIVRRKPHYLACLAAFQASSIVFTGAGKVGSENGRPWSGYQISQRADFLETFLGEQTTYNRPLVNARDESLCGSSWAQASGGAERPELARLHVIFFDATLCQIATLLRAGTMQIVTAMLEAGSVPAHLALDDPLEALQAWSRDPSLTARARLVSGEPVTAVELQRRFLEQAAVCASKIGFDGIVPRARDVIALWDDTLQKLHNRDFESLRRRLDWVLKQEILQRAMASRPSLSWSSPELRHLDQLYASIDEAEGLFCAYERSGLIDTVVSDDDIGRAVEEPPDDTRAWTRAYLLRRAGATRVEDIDWDRVDIRLHGRVYGWTERTTVLLPCPYRSTKNENHELFAQGRSLEDIVAGLEPERATWSAAFTPTKFGAS